MIILSQEQQHQLQEISEKLTALRTEKYISLTQVADQTHIRLTYLQNLELLNFAELPEPIFIQGFIRRYAEYLGLDGHFWASKLTVDPQTIKEEQPCQNSSKNSSKNLSDFYGLYICTPLILIYVLLLLAASLGLFYLVRSQNISPQIPDSLQTSKNYTKNSTKNF